MNFGQRLRDLRTEKNISQDELAKLIDRHESAISKYERQKKEPNYKVLNKLANFFDVSVDYLLGRTNVRIPYKMYYTGDEFGKLAEIEKHDFDPEDIAWIKLRSEVEDGEITATELRELAESLKRIKKLQKPT